MKLSLRGVEDSVEMNRGHAYADAHIIKPFRTRELSETVKHLLKVYKI